MKTRILSVLLFILTSTLHRFGQNSRTLGNQVWRIIKMKIESKACLQIVFLLFVLIIPIKGESKTWFVSPSGNDNNIGNIQHPFKTITNAIGKMSSGDTCMLRKGIYREEIVIDREGITLSAYPEEYVLITGCDLVKGKGEKFIIPENKAICTRIKYDKKVYQFFINGKRMDIARWPNKTSSMLSMEDWESSRVDAVGEEKKVTMPSVPVQFQSANFWKGGYYIGVNSEATTKLSTWFSGGGRIISSEGELLRISQTCFGVGTKYANGNGFGYIINTLGALDTNKEWYWGDGYLYFKYPNGKVTKDVSIEARTRLYILDITAGNVKVRGINFKAGSVLLGGNNADIGGCTFRYISPFVWNFGDNGEESGALCNWGDYKNGSSGICVLGNGLLMKDCYVARSWFNGIVLWGDSCIVENCIIEDVNWMGKRCSGINSYGADNNIRYCTIRNTGASSIEGGNGLWLKKYAIRNIWEHNRCENACNLVVDQGFFYVNHQSGAAPSANSEWRYNLLIHNQGPDKGEWTNNCVGLYVDNSSSGYKVHHNVVVDTKEGIRYNDTEEREEAGKNIYFYNNTFYKVDHCMSYQFWNDKEPAHPNAEVIVENNLGIGCGGYGYGDRNHEKVFGASNVEFADSACVKDIKNLDFRLKEKQYIDSGVLIQEIDMKFAGSAPDIGAFETGFEPWNAGSTLTIPDFTDEERNIFK